MRCNRHRVVHLSNSVVLLRLGALEWAVKGVPKVRAPRITEEAAERLRLIAFEYRLDPGEALCRIILGESLLGDAKPRGVEIGYLLMRRQMIKAKERLSEPEMVELERISRGQL